MTVSSLRALIDQATAQRDIADSSDMAAWELLGVLRLETADLLDRAMTEVAMWTGPEVKAGCECAKCTNRRRRLALLVEFEGLLSTNQEGTET